MPYVDATDPDTLKGRCKTKAALDHADINGLDIDSINALYGKFHIVEFPTSMWYMLSYRDNYNIFCIPQMAGLLGGAVFFESVKKAEEFAAIVGLELE